MSGSSGRTVEGEAERTAADCVTVAGLVYRFVCFALVPQHFSSPSLHHTKSTLPHNKPVSAKYHNIDYVSLSRTSVSTFRLHLPSP